MKYVILANSNDKKFDIPRQLLNINGEKLICRTIRLLKENGVNDIIITASDKRFNNLGAEVFVPNKSDYNYSNGTGYWLNAFPFELMDAPVCFIWGDVYFSEDAIKTIVNTDSTDDLFFCSHNNKSRFYIKKHDEPFAYKVINTDRFKKHINICKKAKDDGLCCREPIIWEVYRSIHNQDINEHKMTKDYITINDCTCDIDSKEDFSKLLNRLGGKDMIKVEVIEEFTLERFNEVKDLERLNKNEDGRLFVGDTFWCEKDLADYLTGGNDKKKVVVKIIEVKPIELPKAEIKFDADIKPDVKIEVKPKKKKPAKK